MTIAEALLRLAVARGGTLDELQGDVYLEGLADKNPIDVIAACKSLQFVERAEFDPVLPTLATIRKRVDMETNIRRRAALPRALPSGAGFIDKPVSAEKLANFREAVRENIARRHSMNGDGNG